MRLNRKLHFEGRQKRKKEYNLQEINYHDTISHPKRRF